MAPIPEPRILSSADHDDLPLQSFLVRASDKVDRPCVCMRLVRPNHPEDYHKDYLTPGNRLVYYFWRHLEGDKSEAIKRLATMGRSGMRRWHWIVKPGDPGYELLDAFKLICDHRRGQIVTPTLLYRALGLEAPERFDIAADPANL